MGLTYMRQKRMQKQKRLMLTASFCVMCLASALSGLPVNADEMSEARLAVQDIDSLLTTTGLTYQQYRDYITRASLLVNRLPESSDKENLAELIYWHGEAAKCWHNDIFKTEYPKPDPPVVYKIRKDFGKIVNSWSECRSYIWNTVIPKKK